MRIFRRSPALSAAFVATGIVAACETVLSGDVAASEMVSRVGSRIAAVTGHPEYHLGLILMAKAGYDPHAARDLWVRMATASQGSGRPPEFLSTHPSEPTRIRQIEAWMPEAMQTYRPR